MKNSEKNHEQTRTLLLVTDFLFSYWNCFLAELWLGKKRVLYRRIRWRNRRRFNTFGSYCMYKVIGAARLPDIRNDINLKTIHAHHWIRYRGAHISSSSIQLRITVNTLLRVFTLVPSSSLRISPVHTGRLPTQSQVARLYIAGTITRCLKIGNAPFTLH